MSNSLDLFSDQQLIHLFKEGNEQAIATILKRYKQNIFSAIYVKVRDRYVAEDLFQEAFIKIIHNLKHDKYSEQGKFLPWAIRIAQNLCIDYFRKNKQNSKVIFQEGTDFLEFLCIDNDNALKRMQQKETEDTVQSLLDKLPEDQRDVIILRIYADLSFREIAEMTNVGINTALGRMRYALMNLRRLIEENKMVLR